MKCSITRKSSKLGRREREASPKEVGKEVEIAKLSGGISGKRT